MQITTQNTGSWSEGIRQFIVSQFPSQPWKIGEADLVDLLTDLVVGTGQTRFGPKPKPEGLVKIRGAIDKNQPIPFMVPWGARKPDGGSLDMAEIMAIKTLASFQSAVSDLYRPGVQMAIRLEDASVPYLLNYEEGIPVETLEKEVARYTEDFRRALELFCFDSFLLLKPESAKVTTQEFESAAAEFTPVVEKALRHYSNNETQEAEDTLGNIDWTGGMAYEMREYYYGLYDRLYPDKDHDFKTQSLARYFGAAIARRKLKVRGDLPEWEGKFIDFSFAHPIPGTGGYFGARVHRRTVPAKMCKQHLAPWRARGFIEIDGEDNMKVKLRTYDRLPSDLKVGRVTLEDSQDSVCVEVPYCCSGE